MYDERHQDESAQFDRLVDGEMSADERGRLLASLDDRPGGWRQCALAFLEAQSWKADFSHVAQESVAQETIARKTTATSVARSPDSTLSGDVRSTGRRTAQWLAIAAGLLIALGLGSLWRVDRSASTIVDALPAPVDQMASDPPPVGQLSPAERRSRDALTFWVRDGAGSAQRVHVPLVDAGALDRQLGVEFRSGLPDKVREHLRQNGYDVQSTRRYAPLWLENGGSLVLPVEDTRIVPVSPEIY